MVKSRPTEVNKEADLPTHVDEAQINEKKVCARSSRKELRRAKLMKKFEKEVTKQEIRAQQDTDFASRHNPKYTSGSFWRDRKEKKKRTLFVGNLPGELSKAKITETLNGVLGGEGEIESVDVITSRNGTGLKQCAYVLFCTLDAATRAQPVLDGYALRLEGPHFRFDGTPREVTTKLRCNFADDSKQRSLAIQIRDTHK